MCTILFDDGQANINKRAACCSLRNDDNVYIKNANNSIEANKTHTHTTRGREGEKGASPRTTTNTKCDRNNKRNENLPTLRWICATATVAAGYAYFLAIVFYEIRRSEKKKRTHKRQERINSIHFNRFILSVYVFVVFASVCALCVCV